MRPLTADEKDMIVIALVLRENIIETGNPNIDAATVERMGEKAAKDMGVKLKALSTDQMKLLIASKKLKSKILTGRITIYEN